MAEALHIKHPREEEEEEHGAEATQFDNLSSNSNSKRLKPYTNHILSLLDDEEEDKEVESSRDISAIFTTLERELSSSAVGFGLPAAEEDARRQPADENSSVMRRLLEASDDELGIPNAGELNSGEELGFDCACKELVWEIEDVSANYSDNVLLPSPEPASEGKFWR